MSLFGAVWMADLLSSGLGDRERGKWVVLIMPIFRIWWGNDALGVWGEPKGNKVLCKMYLTGFVWKSVLSV